MKVKELITILNTLDQEKEIKTTLANGYEFEESTSKNIIIDKYKEFPYSKRGDREYYAVSDRYSKDTEKDFYLIRGFK